MGSVPTSARPPTEPLARRGLDRDRRARVPLVTILAPALGALLAFVACTSVPARTALQGDLPALKAAIEQAEKSDGLSASGVRELAGAVLKRELSAAPEPSGVAADEFPDVKACTGEIRSLLEEVANGASD